MIDAPENYLPPSDEMASFLREIKADPHNDDLRLIFADWLDEQNDPRGEFIRLQLDLNNVEQGTPEFREIREQGKQYVQALAEWVQPRPLGTFGFRMRRGLLHLKLNLERPTTGEVKKQRWEDLISTRWWLWVSSFQVYLELDLLTHLARSSGLLTLAKLDLRQNHLGDLGTRLIADSPSVRNLTALNLSDTDLSVEGVQALAESPHLRNLRALGLARNSFGDEEAQILAESAELTSLCKIQVRTTHITSVGVDTLQQRFGEKSVIWDKP